MKSIQDKPAPFVYGFKILFIIAALCVAFWLISPTIFYFSLVPLGILAFIVSSGFTIVHPNEAKVISFFGRYVGTIKENGFLYTIPFSTSTTVPLRLTNFLTDHLKVNDLNGNPIEIGAVVVWRVTDAAQALFNIDHYQTFLANQSDIAIRTIAAHYPYDSDDGMSLRGNIDEIADQLKNFLQEKLIVAGIIIEDAKLTHLAYSSEIAQTMLKRQQASAVFQARAYMVKNALATIDDVVKHFEKSKVKISDDKKMDLINNLLIVMTSDKEATPTINLNKN